VSVALLTVPATAHTADLTGKPRIIDGDGIEMAGERIRLHGIDAPEANQLCNRADGSILVLYLAPLEKAADTPLSMYVLHMFNVTIHHGFKFTGSLCRLDKV
jgi:endonuclease YncB( thermonuclease family)